MGGGSRATPHRHKGPPVGAVTAGPVSKTAPCLNFDSTNTLPDIPNSPCAHPNPLPPLKSGAPRGSYPSGDLQLTPSPSHTPYAESPTVLVINTITTICWRMTTCRAGRYTHIISFNPKTAPRGRDDDHLHFMDEEPDLESGPGLNLRKPGHKPRSLPVGSLAPCPRPWRRASRATPTGP